MLKDTNTDELSKFIKIFKDIHRSAEEVTKKSQEETGINNIAVNSTTYCEFLKIYNDLITKY
jgi:hypothetical protein